MHAIPLTFIIKGVMQVANDIHIVMLLQAILKQDIKPLTSNKLPETPIRRKVSSSFQDLYRTSKGLKSCMTYCKLGQKIIG
jgi:hypothetical protein